MLRSVQAIHHLLWLGWAAYYRRSYAWKVVLTVCGSVLPVALELGDFPPLWLV